MSQIQHNVIALSELLQNSDGERKFYSMIKNFSCQFNPDVESFLFHTAVANQRMGISRTSLVYKGQSLATTL